jgi:hypothetical protein
MKIFASLLLMQCVFWSSPLLAQKESSCWQIQNGLTYESFIIDLVIEKNHFNGTTRKSTLRQLLGFGKYHVGVLLNKIPKQIVSIDGEVTQKGDTLFLSGDYSSFWSKQHFEAVLLGDSLTGYLLKEKKDGQKVTNLIKGHRKDSASAARDYVSITQKAIDVTEEKLFLADIGEYKEWQRFKKNVSDFAPKIRDDYEFWLCYNYGVRKLPFSHYGVQFKKKPRISQPINVINEKHVEYNPQDSVVGLLTVHNFSGDGIEMIQSIEAIKAHKPQTLIIDLRNNGGGSIQAAMPLAQYLTSDTVYGGVFLTQKWFKKHSDLPDVEDYKNLPHFSAASYSLIIEGIHEEEGLCLRIDPAEVTFDGKIYLLVNNLTASTCEPFVYSLKHSKAAIIVGEKTAGKMLNGESFPINNEVNLFVPTADFYAVDGYKIDQNGVSPDIKVASEEALDFVLNLTN